MRGDAAAPTQSASSPPSAPNGSSPSPHRTSPKSATLNGSQNGHSDANGVSVIHTNGVASTSNLAFPPTFYGHQREEVARILIQGLTDLGYNSAAQALSQESGYTLESGHASRFRTAILSGDWTLAERLLRGPTNRRSSSNGESRSAHADADTPGRSNQANGGSVARMPVTTDAQVDEMLFAIRQQKYLELLEKRDTTTALKVLQQELQELVRLKPQVHTLASLIMCRSAEDLRSQARWDGAEGESRQQLLSELSKSISPAAMIPEHRLAVLFNQVKEYQVQNCLYHNVTGTPSLYTDHVCDRSDFPLQQLAELDSHEDEVWFVAFSNDGTRLASAGKDKSVILYDTTAFGVIRVLAEHDRPVVYVAWSPDDRYLISCSKDHHARLWDTNTGDCLQELKHHDEPVTTAAWAPDGATFVTGSLDLQKPLAVWPQTTTRDTSPVYTFENLERVQDCAIASVSSASPYLGSNEDSVVQTSATPPAGAVRLVAICADHSIHIYDYARRDKLRHIKLDQEMTCLSLSRNGQEMLISLSCNEIWLLGTETGDMRQKYRGQQQGHNVIRSCFGGASEGFVVSGGEDGKICVWHRHSGRMIEQLDGCRPACVNTVAWNTAQPSMFASASDDHLVRMQVTPLQIVFVSLQAANNKSRWSIPNPQGIPRSGSRRSSNKQSSRPRSGHESGAQVPKWGSDGGAGGGGGGGGTLAGLGALMRR